MGGGPGSSPAGEQGTRGWDEFAPLYDEHHERLYRVAMLLCHGSEALAEDAVTETFLRIYPAWVEGRIDAFFPHARQILVNHVMGRHLTDAGIEPFAATRRGAERADRPIDESIADASTTFQLLEQLDPRQRTAVVLRYFEDLPYDQIAATMGVSTATAQEEVTGGLHQMRVLMGEEGAAS